MAESPFGPHIANRLQAQLCQVINLTGARPLGASEDDWLPGIRYEQED